MSETYDGGPAFPHETQGVSTQGNTFKRTEAGMSLRDYFAAAALTGMGLGCMSDETLHDHAARVSYALADAMLKAREVKP